MNETPPPPLSGQTPVPPGGAAYPLAFDVSYPERNLDRVSTGLRIFAVIPIVRSPYPNWDREDREDDVRRFERGQLVLESGHETPASTVRDGVLDEVLEMPSESGWPILLASALSIVFIMLLTTASRRWLMTASRTPSIRQASLVPWPARTTSCRD